MKNLLRVNLCVILVLFFFTACKSSHEIQKTTLEVAISSSPLALDPRIATDAEGEKICQLIFDGLVVRDENLNIIPRLAKRYEKLSPTSYRFYLRRGVMFHSGLPLTSKDVVYTFKSILDGIVASPFRHVFSRIKEIVPEDDFTVRFDLNEPYAPFLSSLAIGIISKVDAKRLGKRFRSEPVGSGPYRLLRFEPENVVELEANASYFGDIPKILKLKFHVVTDDNVRVLKLIKGDVDLIQNGVPALLLPKVLETKDLLMDSDDGIVMTYLGMNLRNRYLKDKRVRQAIAYALNRDEIINHRLGGMAIKADSILSPLNRFHADDLNQYNYDPNRARTLLEEAGFKEISLTQKTSTVKERIDIARMISYQLEQVGIDVRVKPFEWGTFYRDIKNGNFELYTLSWVGVVDPDIFYNVSHSSQFPPTGMNRSRYKDERVDELVVKARKEMNVNKRKKMYAWVQEILLEDLPFIPLWYEKNIVVYNENLKDVAVRPDASYLMLINISKS